MTQSEKDQVYSIIYQLGVDLFSGRCFVCRKEPENCSGKGFTIHHWEYRENEKDWTDFKHDPKQRVLTDSERLAYWQYMEPIIRREPWRFLFVDNWHHVQIGRIRRFKDDSVIMRLFMAVIFTQYTPKRRNAAGIPKV